MKRFLILICLGLFISIGSFAQKFPNLDNSPMDASYYPPRAAFRAFAKTEQEIIANRPKIRVLYSRPQKKSRKVFGELLKYGEMWRVGANESTEVLLFEDMNIGGAKVSKGRYTLYAIPNENEWQIFLSTDTDGWGQYSFDPEKTTVAKLTIPTEKTNEELDALTIVFQEINNGANMIIGWENTMVKVPFEF